MPILQMLTNLGMGAYSPIRVTANNVTDFSTTTAPSGTSTASVVEGDGTHTYSWTRVSGLSTLSGSSTSQTATFVGVAGSSISSVYRITVNDGVTTDSFDITVNLRGSTA